METQHVFIRVEYAVLKACLQIFYNPMQLTSFVNMVSIAELGCKSNFQNILLLLWIYSSSKTVEKAGLIKTKTAAIKMFASDSTSAARGKLRDGAHPQNCVVTTRIRTVEP